MLSNENIYVHSCNLIYLIYIFLILFSKSEEISEKKKKTLESEEVGDFDYNMPQLRGNIHNSV